MPRNSRSAKPPEAMTWGRAVWVLVFALILDGLRLFFNFFWFLGPALVALYCTAKTAGYLSFLGSFGMSVAATTCSTVTAIVGGSVSEVTIPFGVLMADAIGFTGALALGTWIVLRNPRLFTEDTSSKFWALGSFGLALVPFVDALPLYSGMLWRLYRRQIKRDKVLLRRWQREQAVQQQLEEQERLALLAQIQAQQGDAANDDADAADEEESGELTRQTASRQRLYGGAANDDVGSYAQNLKKAA